MYVGQLINWHFAEPYAIFVCHTGNTLKHSWIRLWFFGILGKPHVAQLVEH